MASSLPERLWAQAVDDGDYEYANEITEQEEERQIDELQSVAEDAFRNFLPALERLADAEKHSHKFGGGRTSRAEAEITTGFIELDNIAATIRALTQEPRIEKLSREAIFRAAKAVVADMRRPETPPSA